MDRRSVDLRQNTVAVQAVTRTCSPLFRCALRVHLNILVLSHVFYFLPICDNVIIILCYYILMSMLIEILIAVVLPPLAVFLKVGLSFHFWINIILTLLGYVPGLLHALWVVFTF